MKQLITVTIDASSNDALKADTGIIYRGIAQALSKTNGSEVHIHSENAENTEAMHFLMTRLMRWSGGSRAPGNKKRIVRKKGWLAGIKNEVTSQLSNAKDEIMEGLAGEL